ncbi:hypothetical protein LTR10_019698 [Elasticomyces elasticus]|nr:hypothetical protein LTR10_019698 [Elasticomyces elasticus]KAK5022108.1 hypothetical protein LTS07_010358 [Exophiala sideris]
MLGRALLFFSLIPAFLAAPLVPRQESNAALQSAALAWQADTGVVSAFLSEAASLSGSALTAAAQNALNAENDELLHKAVLDAEFLNVAHPNLLVVAANAVLVNAGTFQFVVNGLTLLADSGASFTKAQIEAEVLKINLDRCNLVLPSIDTYFAVTASYLKEADFKAPPTQQLPSLTKLDFYHVGNGA